MDDTSTVSWDDLDSVSVEELFNMEEYPPSSNDETYSSSQDTFTFDLNLPAENFSDLGKRSRFDDYEANESVSKYIDPFLACINKYLFAGSL